MGIQKNIKKIASIIVVLMITSSCSNIEPIETLKDEPTKVQTEASNTVATEKPADSAPESVAETWENYLVNIIQKRDIGSLMDLKYPEINLDEYLKQGKIYVDKGNPETDWIFSSEEGTFLIDINKDGTDELWVNICQGSMRNYSANIFEKKEGKYVFSESVDGFIIPVKYNGEMHFIENSINFSTKFSSGIIEYEPEGIKLKQKAVYGINYIYDVSKLTDAMKKIIDNDFLNKLSCYEIPEINIAKVNKESDIIELKDTKNKNSFKFMIKLWPTTVGYAPNEWKIQSADDITGRFNGIDMIETHEGSETVCFGLKFYKDEWGNLFLLKLSYPYFTTKPRKDGDLILQLFRFNKDTVEMIEKEIIEHGIEIRKEQAPEIEAI